MGYIKLPGTMGHSGGKLIYSNNPEAINKYHIGYPLRNAGKYTIGTTVSKGEVVNFEYYHANYTGGPLQIAVAVINNTGKPVAFKVSREGKATGNVTTTSTINIAAKCNAAFYNSSARWDTINNQQTFLLASSGPLNDKEMANGKVEISPIDGSLSVRIIFYDPNKTTQTSAASFDRATDDGKLRTTAMFKYNHRSISLNLANNQNKSFLLFPANAIPNWKTLNKGEYPQSHLEAIAGVDGIGTQQMNDAGTVILDTRWLVIGNYGIIYDLNLSGCNGRKIQFSKATNNAGTIMTRVINGTWYAKALPFTYNASTTSLLQIILIGGNSGDLSMKIL